MQKKLLSQPRNLCPSHKKRLRNRQMLSLITESTRAANQVRNKNTQITHPTSARIMHMAETRDIRAVGRKAALVLAVDVRNRFRHAKGQRSAGKDMAAVECAS